MAFHSQFGARFAAAFWSFLLVLALASCAGSPPPPPPPQPQPHPHLLPPLPLPLPLPRPTPPAPPPKPTILEISLEVAINVNPDARGRASPVIARLLELKSLAVFQSADFFSLVDHDKETLGSDLVAKEELALQPGDKRQLRREMVSDTRFVAVIAGYRDIERSKWRATLPVPLNQTTPLTVSVREREISIVQRPRPAALEQRAGR